MSTKESSWLMNLIMLIIGAISIVLAIMSLVASYGFVTPPAWWPSGLATATFNSMITLPIGVWMVIAAIGLWDEQEWAVGASFVCFTVIIAQGLIGVVTGILAAPVDFWLAWPNWVAFILILVSIVGFLYLLFTMKRYK
ncbi:MAG: hypothetical protein RBG13Loki_4356 [Promethearchaeota archaeon CR_4]|nr:MAG: hypothetical protein RBG13Loki_4356 [Candidatus Lokiarchaeota archaeon CR_4]